jgi:two-component system response regulator YesN
MKVLLVDDEPLELMSLHKILSNQENHIQIKTAENGFEAIEILKAEQIDLVFLDIRMPRLNGLEVLKIIREDYADIEVAIVSAFGEFEYAQEALELGAAFYLLKPFSSSDLIHTFEKLKKRWNENRRVTKLLTHSIIEKYVYSDVNILSIDELKRQFRFYPEALVAIKCKNVKWIDMFQATEMTGFLSPETIEGVSVFITEKRFLDKVYEKLLEISFELSNEPFLYGVGVSRNIKSAYLMAVKKLNESDQSIVNQCTRYIQENYIKPLTLKEVAHAVHVSSSHLNRLLKKEVGKTFTEILLTVRINKAKGLLEQGYNIEFVSDKVGFNSSAYFAVSFKKFTGISPSQYRRETG